MPPRPRPRGPRADARRNYERLVAAAETAFNAHGSGASLDDIARAAGVGNATLYRHFPTRQQLLEVVYGERLHVLCDEAERARASHPPCEALIRWLRTVIRHVTDNRGLRDAFITAHDLPDYDHMRDDEPQPVAGWHRAIRESATPLLLDAQEIEAVREDLTVNELLALANGIARVGDGNHDFACRLLTLVIEGLTSKTAPTPPT